MKHLFIAAFCFFTVHALAQKKANPTTYAESITEKDLKKHLYYIAGPETEGRGTGTPGIAKAAAYIENEFKNYGLLPAANGQYQMSYTLLQDSVAPSTVAVNGIIFKHGEDFTGTNRNNRTQNISATEIVYAGYGIVTDQYNDYEGKDVRGKIVLIREGEPINADSTYPISGSKKRSDWSNNNYNKKYEIAAEKGAAAVFVIVNKFTVNPAGLRRGAMYPAFMKSNAKSVNRYFVSKALADALFPDSVSAAFPYKANVAINFNKISTELLSTNVVGLLPGTDKKDEYVVITAHMDHLGKRGDVIYYGADDDGSGTCAVMEMAQAYSLAAKKGKGPRRSILFMTVSGEEMGLWGSAYYAQHPLFPLEKTTVNLNIDMIGRVGSDYIKDAPDSLNYVYVIGDDKLSSDLRPINELANNNVNLKLDYRYNDPKDPNRFYYRSDHYNFAEKGVPIIFYFDGVHKDYHRATDTPDKINYDLYAKRTKLVFYTSWLMANKEDMLKRDIPLK
jgi:hypothetical protein